MNLQGDTPLPAMIRSAIEQLGDAVPGADEGRAHGALPLYADMGGVILLRPDLTLIEVRWDEPAIARDPDPRFREVALTTGVARYPWLYVPVPASEPRDG